MKTLQSETSLQGYTLCGGWTEETRVIPGNQLIKAVRGEYYGYSARFTRDKPLYVFAKCKSNKARALATVPVLGQEANLLFRLNGVNPTQVCSMPRAHELGLFVESVEKELFCETWVAHAPIGAMEFHALHSLDKLQGMVNMCTEACSGRQSHVNIKPGSVVAMMTDTGKYGMFLVKRLTRELVLVDAFHILL